MTADRNPLADYWHPVALSAEVGEAPRGVRLLGEDVVLWRADGAIVALEDTCVHRGTKLSLGWVEKGEIVCPYHGWSYGRDGVCTRIPAAPPDRPIPARARARRLDCVERYGLVFVCPGTPRRAIYDVPEIDDPAYRWHIVGPVHWNTSAERSVENFMDEAHLPWAHPGMLGNRDNAPPVPAREVIESDGEFFFECQSEVRNRLDPTKFTVNRLPYRVVVPYTVYHENVYPNGDRVIDLFFTSPVGDRACIRYMLVGRNFGLDQPPDKLIAFTLKIWEQDRVLIESQRPPAMPLDLHDELHVRGPDAPSIAYRRMMAALLS